MITSRSYTDSQKAGRRRNLYFGLIAMSLLLCLLPGLYLGFSMYSQEQRTWRKDFRMGLNLEKQGTPEKAISYYQGIQRTMESEFVWARDYQARCHFLQKEIDRSIHEYDSIYTTETLGSRVFLSLGSARDLALRASTLQKERKFAESLPLCDEMIAHLKTLSVHYNPMALDFRESYYEHCSEGYVRKYYALLSLDRKQQAEQLFSEYVVKYESEIMR